MMLSAAKVKQYGLEDIKQPEIDFDNITIESIIEKIEETCGVTPSLEVVNYISGENMKDMVVKVITTIWDYIKKVALAIKKFFNNIFIRDKKLDEDLSKTQEKIVSIKKAGLSPEGKAKLQADLKSQGIESISLEDSSKMVSIGAVAAIDLHDHLGEQISIKEFDSLIGEFNKTMGAMNGYFQQVDTHLKTVSDLKEDVVATGNADRVVSQIKNKPAIPSAMRAKEFDFFTIGKIGQAEHFVEADAKGIQGLADSFNKNVPRLVKNVAIDHINLDLSNASDIVSLADKWHGDLDTVRSAGKLSGQYLKMALALLEEKEKHFGTVSDKIVDILKKEGGDKTAMANFQAYGAGVKAQINYINMYINVMTYYHNAYAKIATSIKTVLDKLLDVYLASF